MGFMSAKHLANNGVFEPQRAFNYKLLLYGFPGVDLLSLVVLNFNIPSYSNENIELPFNNEVVYAAGQTRVEQASVQVRDFVDKDLYGKMVDWRSQVHDWSGNIYWTNIYKKNADLILLAPDESVERTISMEGVWPQSLNGPTVDYSAGTEVLMLEMTLTVDRVYV